MEERRFYRVGSGEYEEINLKVMLLRYLRYWYLYVIGAMLGLGVAYVYLRHEVPQYYISSRLFIKEDVSEASLTGGAFKDAESLRSEVNIDNEIEFLKSAELMQRALLELSLETSFYIEGEVREEEIYGAKIPFRIIISSLDSTAYDKYFKISIKDKNSYEIEEGLTKTLHRFGHQVKRPYGTFAVVITSQEDTEIVQKPVVVRFNDVKVLARVYSNSLDVYQANEMATVLTLSLIDAVPEKGRDILSKLAEVYERNAVEDKRSVAASTINFIDERLEILTAELSNVEKGVEQYKRQNELTDVSSDTQLHLQRASEYSKKLAELEIQIDVLNSIENYIRSQRNQFELVPSSLSLEDPTLLGLVSRFNELQLDRERMLRTAEADHPLVQNMDEQITNLRGNILVNLLNIKNGLAITRDKLQANVIQFKSKIQLVPSIERDLLDINRQQSIKKDLYMYLLEMREESSLMLASNPSKTFVLDAATYENYPISPDKSSIYITSLLIGLFLPLAGVYMKNLLNNKVEVFKDVEQATATPILGEISHNDLIGKTLVVIEREQSVTMELFRLIRANLKFALLESSNRVIMVTSSMSGEGKTFFITNLGASLALTGKRVVVLNLDLRQPKLMHYLELSDDIGVTNYLNDDSVTVNEIVVPYPDLPGLFFIGSGPLPHNATELMMSQRVNELFDKLKEQFDYVLIDSAPVGQVADAFSLAHLVDSCIFIIRYGYTLKAQLDIVDDIYRNKKINNLMIVLNDASGKESYGKGYGYGLKGKDKKSLIKKIIN